MNEQAKPLVSIGIIFRNDIRSIERCLKALQPLRDAVPCELVMADTGSDDGSRAVAEKYADILFEFPWINDFAAARNAVVDRCSGKWYLAVDTDEYLDEDISELMEFLRADDPGVYLCQVNIRNYKTYEMDGAYADFYTLRMVRLSIGARYRGAIHEAWVGIDDYRPMHNLIKTIFHHDGYVNMGSNTEKLKRNMTLLREKVKKEPQNLLVRLQIIESGTLETDYLEQIRKAVALVKRKPAGWQAFGPPILRYAVTAARDQHLPEFQKWTDMAREWFPDSYYTRIDVAAHCILSAYDAKDHALCVRQGEELLNAYGDYRAGRGDMDCQMYSTLQLASPFHENLFRLLVAVSCIEEGMPERAAALLAEVDYCQLDGSQSANLAKTLCSLRSRSGVETDGLVLAAWEGITAPVPSEKRAEERRLNFMLNGSAAFTAAYRQEEARKGQRHAYALFAPLAGKCGLGTAAAVMETEDAAAIEELLRGVEKWNELPFPALSHAIQAGVGFPLAGKPISAEEMEGLANRLAGDWSSLFSLVKVAGWEDKQDMQPLAWKQAMVQALVRNCTWKDEARSMETARLFAGIEDRFLTRYYAPEMLTEENAGLLPPMHRLGWYCARAFAALDAGDAAGYVRYLRKGLTAVEAGKPMAAFLLDHTPEVQDLLAPPPEVQALANQIRTILARYEPDDPAVVALKQSAAYQKVAYFIEGKQ